MQQQETEFLHTLDEFLCRRDVEELITLHPNATAAADFVPPEAWSSWWHWAGEVAPETPQNTEPKWQLLWRYYVHDSPSEEGFAHLPTYVRHLVREARSLQLCRRQGKEATVPGHLGRDLWCPSSPDLSSLNKNLHGMSPKKTHEVLCMSKYAVNLLHRLADKGPRVRHVVDVGAGQAYLSRALRDECALDVLAVDWSPVREEGAARRDESDKRLKKRLKDCRPQVLTEDLDSAKNASAATTGTLSYRKLIITSQSLVTVTDEWIRRSGFFETPTAVDDTSNTPVFLVGLHACGSLTLDILRAMVQQLRVDQPREASWIPVGGLIVGCCYNLLRSEDYISLTERKVELQANHLQLAAQVPSQWARTPSALADTTLAFRKMSWRALLAAILSKKAQERPSDGGGAPQLKRLGRLNDTTYDSWEAFLAIAERRLGANLTGEAARDPAIESRLEVFHFLRCILGPVVESFLLLDRKVWLRHQLEDVGMRVHLVNMFDQGLGSARNVGIVVVPEYMQW